MFRAASSSDDLLRRHRGCCSTGCSVKVQTFGGHVSVEPRHFVGTFSRLFSLLHGILWNFASTKVQQLRELPGYLHVTC